MKSFVIAAALGLAFLMSAGSQATALLTINVDKNVSAKIEKERDHVSVHFLPGGKTQTLKVDSDATDAEGDFRLEVEDFNFDGHSDLAITGSYDGVTYGYQIFLYDAYAQQFVPLSFAMGSEGGGSCSGMTGVTLDKKTRTLYSACRGAGWVVDAYRYRADGRLYLYQAITHTINDVALERLLGLEDGDVPVGRLVTYDEHGNVVASTLSRQDRSPSAKPIDMRVAVAHLPLYAKSEVAATLRYLIKGDSVRVDDVSDDDQWLKVIYRSSAKGDVRGWVKVSDLSSNKP
jgi:small nuclear ribonucleoprotein (snRNP)-like protein